jgi:(p)ppGpp synthase/HD superfamily hydrolase
MRKRLFDRALIIAEDAHKGQSDKAGKDYLTHPIAVSEMGETIEEKIVGLLHDVVEDSDWTLNQLLAAGFSADVVDAVDRLTKRKGENLKDYMDRVKGNILSVKVKVNDLTHNMDISRITNPKEKDYKRLEKYKTQKKELEEFLAKDSRGK